MAILVWLRERILCLLRGHIWLPCYGSDHADCVSCGAKARW